jgi:hypothetical protein
MDGRTLGMEIRDVYAKFESTYMKETHSKGLDLLDKVL